MKKDAGIAAVLNAVMPGLGWIYIESLVPGIGSIILNGAFLYLTLFDNIYSIFIWGLFWIFSIMTVYNAVKEGEQPIKRKERMLVNCERCKKDFYLLGDGDVECPHCGNLYKNKK